ncbi:MAG: glycosyltransferase family 39 protein [Verrucomicrobiota bacterium]|nr:glycosyltransferase family 39 protein [Verrucomicrobiota bacterium]
MQPAIRNFALLFFASLLFHLAGSWSLPLIDRDEPRFAEASREMLERSDFVVPYFNNSYRFDKPPLTYWFQAASYRVFGENEFAARFPSAVAAALTAVVLLAWGRRIGDERVGWWAAVMFTLCWQTTMHAKAAVADMWLVLFVTLAHWAGYELLRDRLGGGGARGGERPTSNVQRSTSNAEAVSPRWWWVFYLALAFAFLAKGPIGWTPLLAVAATLFFLPGVQLQRRFLFLTGILLMLAVVAVWGIPALVRTKGEFFHVGIGKHVVDRSFNAMEGHGGGSLAIYFATLPFYFVAIFLTFFPWSLSLPALVQRLWRERDPLDDYLLAGTAAVFVIFTLVKTKLPHYTLPAYPLLALLLAKWFVTRRDAAKIVRRRAIGFGAFALLLAAASPMARHYVPAVELVRQARADLTPEMQFGAVRYHEPSLVWYFRRYVRSWMTEVNDADAKAFMETPGARFLVLPTKLATELYPTIPEGWKAYRVRGLNVARLRPVELTMLLKRS